MKNINLEGWIKWLQVVMPEAKKKYNKYYIKQVIVGYHENKMFNEKIKIAYFFLIFGIIIGFCSYMIYVKYLLV